ncbi:MAG: hypothetical protein JWR16_12 [Nevskia sp.]|nr:hypothetical protein [Nevskia sp.]
MAWQILSLKLICWDEQTPGLDRLMVITDRFIYLHLHKSAGTFINEALLRFVPGAHMLGYHLPRSQIPAELRHLPILGFVRNPWSYYVSWYAFQSNLPRQNHLFRCVSDAGRLGFQATICNLLSLGVDGALLDRVMEGLPDTFTNVGLNLPRWALAPLRNSGQGFYSFLYRHIYGGSGSPLYVGRTESLQTDLLSFFESINLRPSAELHGFVCRDAPRNTSPHEHYAEYYDSSLQTLVGVRDGDLIQSFDYRFG